MIVESFRPGVTGRLGIGYEAVRAVNERIVYCSTSGFGQTGPRSQWAGHDLNYLAVSGLLALQWTRRGRASPHCRAPRWPTSPRAGCMRPWR